MKVIHATSKFALTKTSSHTENEMRMRMRMEYLERQLPNSVPNREPLVLYSICYRQNINQIKSPEKLNSKSKSKLKNQ